MIQLSELIGHDAIDVQLASSSGSVTGIAVTGGRIVAIGIDGVSVDASTVRGFDGDIVTHGPASAEPHDALPVTSDPRGTKVIDRNGDLLGRLSDLTITDTGDVETIALDHGHSIHGSRLQVIGSYAVVVSVDDRPD